MADIDQLLANIQNARYGREVRGSIYQAIDGINDIAESAEATAEGMQGQIDDLHDNSIVAYGRITGGDLDDYNTPGTWFWTSEATIDNVPPDLTNGRLVVFGSDSATVNTKAQLVLGRGRAYFRYGIITSGTAQWEKWDQIFVHGVVGLASSNNLDDYTGLGTWFWTSSVPQGSPTESLPARLVVFGSASDVLTSKVQVVFDPVDMYFRMGTNVGGSYVWGDWREVGGGGGGITLKKYVALGASTTVGSDGDGHISPYSYPYWVGLLGDFEVHNLAVSATDFVAKGADGDRQNYMDVLTDASNKTLFEAADLITFWMGTNDDGRGVALGSYDDYYAYDPSVSPSTLYANCTKAAAMNFCIKYASEHFPNAQLVFVLGAKSVPFRETATIVNNKVVVSPPSNNYANEMATLAKQVCDAALVPLADASKSYGTVWNAADKYTPGAVKNLHPTLGGYPQYGRAIAAAILAKYRN